MHTLTAHGANDGETDETRLPPPEELLLTRLDDPQLAELIERHVDYTDASGRPVHLTAPFVKHYRQRDDNMLPIATAVATLPIVLPDGTILSVCGLDRRRGIVFRVPDELQQLLPSAGGLHAIGRGRGNAVPDRRMAGGCRHRLFGQVRVARAGVDHH